MREVIQDEENLIINGDEVGNPLEFDGLDTYITTNITDDNNNALGFRTSLLDDAVALLLNTYGVMPTAIWTSYGMKKAINQSLAGDVRVNVNAGTADLGTGVDITFYQSMVGKIPFVSSMAIHDDAVSYIGNIVSNIYVVTETSVGQEVVYYLIYNLYPNGKSPQ